VVIDIGNQNYRMKEAITDVFRAPFDRTPLAAANLRVDRVLIRGVAMKLMKDDTRNQLHIRTAYPLSAMPAGGSHCSITYNTGAQPQDLPI
jgi:hypothetical protein